MDDMSVKNAHKLYMSGLSCEKVANVYFTTARTLRKHFKDNDLKTKKETKKLKVCYGKK